MLGPTACSFLPPIVEVEMWLPFPFLVLQVPVIGEIVYSAPFVHACVRSKLLQLCWILFDPMDCSLSASSVCGNSPGENTGVGHHALLQGNLPDSGIELMSPAFPASQAGCLLPAQPGWEAHILHQDFSNIDTCTRIHLRILKKFRLWSGSSEQGLWDSEFLS